MISGVMAPSQGRILYDQQCIAGLPPYRVARLGIARTFQNIRLFPHMTVLQNVSVGQNRHAVTGIRSLLPLYRQQEARLGEEAAQLLDFVGLLGRRDDLASELPYGDQRRL